MQETRVQSLGQEDPLEKKKWQPTPVFLPRKSHGQRSLAGYSLLGRKESDTTECVCVCVCVCTPEKPNSTVYKLLLLFSC